MGNSIRGIPWTEGNSKRRLEDQHALIQSVGVHDSAESFFENYPCRVLKLPHLVTCGSLDGIEMWAKCRPNLRVLLMHRNTLAVNESLSERGMKTFGETLEEGAET